MKLKKTKIRDYYESNVYPANAKITIDQGTYDGDSLPISEMNDGINDGWHIDRHENGYTLCSPGVGAAELGYRNEGDCTIEIRDDGTLIVTELDGTRHEY